MKTLEQKRKLTPLTEEQERKIQVVAARKLAEVNAHLATVDREQFLRFLKEQDYDGTV